MLGSDSSFWTSTTTTILKATSKTFQYKEITNVNKNYQQIFTYEQTHITAYRSTSIRLKEIFNINKKEHHRALLITEKSNKFIKSE